MIDKGIEARRGVNVDFGYGAVERELQRAARLVLRIEVERCDGDFICRKPLGQSDDEAGFADSALASHGENDSLRECHHCSPPLLSGLKVRSHGTRSGRVSHSVRSASPAIGAASQTDSGKAFSIRGCSRIASFDDLIRNKRRRV